LVHQRCAIGFLAPNSRVVLRLARRGLLGGLLLAQFGRGGALLMFLAGAISVLDRQFGFLTLVFDSGGDQFALEAVRLAEFGDQGFEVVGGEVHGVASDLSCTSMGQSSQIDHGQTRLPARTAGVVSGTRRTAPQRLIDSSNRALVRWR